MSNDGNGGSAFSWFLAGLGLGSLLGVLYAPRPGEQTREELLAGALGTTERVKQRSLEATRVAGDYVERGKGQFSNYKSQLGDYVEKGKGQVNQYVATGKDQVTGYVAKGKEAVEVGRQKINEVYSQGVNNVAEQKEKLKASYDAGREAYVKTTVPSDSKEELIPSSGSDIDRG